MTTVGDAAAVTTKSLGIIYIILNHYACEASTIRQVSITEICRLKKLVKTLDEDILEAVKSFEFLGFYTLSNCEDDMDTDSPDVYFTKFSRPELQSTLLNYLASLITFHIVSKKSLTELELEITSIVNEKIILSLSNTTFSFNLKTFDAAQMLLLSPLGPLFKINCDWIDIPWSQSDKTLHFTLDHESTLTDLQLQNLFCRLSPVDNLILNTDNTGYVVFKNDVARVCKKTSGFVGLSDGMGSAVQVDLVPGIIGTLIEAVLKRRKELVENVKLVISKKGRVKNKKARLGVRKVTGQAKVGKKARLPKNEVDLDALMGGFKV